MRRTRSAAAVQHRTFSGLVRRLGVTSYWKAAGIERGMSYEQFRSVVPLQTYTALAPAIGRMQRGEADVLWPGRCSLYARSAGLSTGTPQVTPVTPELLAHFRRASIDALAMHPLRAGHTGALRGRHLFCGSTTECTPIPDTGNPPAMTVELGAIAARALPRWIQRHFHAAGPDLDRITAWDVRVEALANLLTTTEATLLSGMPHRLIQLARVHAQRGSVGGTAAPLPPPNGLKVEGLVHGGVPLGPFEDELRAFFGPQVQFHEIYAASEAFLAAQDGEAPQGLRLLTDRGVFFEFLPMSDFDAESLAQLGPKAVPIEGVTTGIDYAVILTTPGGLARYVLGDVVRLVSQEPARLIHVGRTTLRLNASGEDVSELEVTEALTRLCRRRGWNTVNFHVAPQFEPDPLKPHRQLRHEWWVELRPGTMETPMGPPMALELDADLQRRNPAYAQRRRSGAVDSPVVRLVMPGVFERWLRENGRWDGPQKFARCRPDRLIADQLAAITQFAAD